MKTIRALRSASTRAWNCTRGNVAVTMALGFIAILAAAGVAVDLGSLVQQRSRAQEALDQAVLAAAAANNSDTKATIQNFLKKNWPDVVLKSYVQNRSTSDVEFGAEAEVEVPLMIMEIFGQENRIVKVSSIARAPLAVKTLTITLDQAYGWSAKDLRVKVLRPDGQVLTVLSASYKVTDYSASDGRGTGTTVFNPGNSVTLDSYTQLWFEMDVHPYNDPNGSYTLSSADPTTVDHLFVDGVQQKLGSAPDILGGVLTCEKKVQHAWEDGGNWNYQDIFFTLTANCAIDKTKHVRLTG